MTLALPLVAALLAAVQPFCAEPRHGAQRDAATGLSGLSPLKHRGSAHLSRGRITRFGYAGDRHAGGVSRCLGRRVQPTDWGVAVRGGRCGQLYRVTNHRTGLVIVAPKLDSGPYGAMHDGAWRIKRRASDPGTWRGVLDATPPVFAALGARSFDTVTVERVR